MSISLIQQPQPMPYVNAIFGEFEQLQQASTNWNLDFRLLSKNDLETSLTIYTSRHFQLGRVSLNGKIDQYGLSPIGYRSIVIPVPGGSMYYWLNQMTNENELLVYPKDGTIDAVSFNNFNVYVFSIEEQYLMNTIENMKLSNCLNRFHGIEQRIKSSDDFCNQFHKAAQKFFSYNEKYNKKADFDSYEAILNDLLYETLLQIEDCGSYKSEKIQPRRSIRLNIAVSMINNHIDEKISIPSLCRVTGLSERSLQYAFKERFQVTPKEYIKAVKLNKVRKELVENESQKISTIAAKYGFWHMGQFAAEYKKWFGELPSQSLR